jgi:LPXTG-site transpeptidase (sortase) family protein
MHESPRRPSEHRSPRAGHAARARRQPTGLGPRLARVWGPRFQGIGAWAKARPLLVGGLAMLLVAGILLVSLIPSTPADSPPTPTAAAPETPDLPGNWPAQIEIPAIKLTATVQPLGIEPDGTAEVPPLTETKTTGWYRNGPPPGEPGAAVVIGHRDSLGNTAAFYYLDRLDDGDEIEIVRHDGETESFTVDSIEIVDKSEFPTDQVYGAAVGAQLRLVTCYGRYDLKRETYPKNLIVFATLVSPA